jgi:imidazolonepropionase-like amidohydrolase
MLLIKNISLIDGTGRPPVPGAGILIDQGKIVDAGAHVVEADQIAHVINGEGLTVIPALSDAHTHFSGSSLFSRPPLGRREITYDFAEAREACLRWGITAVRTTGDLLPDILIYRDDVKNGKLVSPRIVSAGRCSRQKTDTRAITVFQADKEIESDACVIIDDETDIEKKVKAVADLNVDWIKVFYAHINKMKYPEPAPRISYRALERTVNAAHELGLPVMVHVDGPDEMADAVRCGADSIEHMLGAGAEKTDFSEDIIDLAKKRNITVVPTMISILKFDDKLPGSVPVWEKLKSAVKMFKNSGIPLAVGCDSGIPYVGHGEAVHDELSCLVQAGFTPMEAICAATSGNAKLLRLDHVLGTIEPGKDADILLLGSDPLKDIHNTKDIRMVLMRGKAVYDDLP